MSRPVVVGVDDSDECLAALDWAADEAAARGTGLRLVNASQWQEHQLQAVKPSRETRTDREQTLLGAMEERVRARRSGVAMATEEVEDAPARALLAAGSDADLLVLGSPGLGTVGGFIVGSVGQEVVAEAKHPVVLVRPDYGDREASAGTPGGDGRRKVVLGLDVHDVKDELLDFAFDFAARHAVPLHIVHTWHFPLSPPCRDCRARRPRPWDQGGAGVGAVGRGASPPGQVPGREGVRGGGSRAGGRPPRPGRVRCGTCCRRPAQGGIGRAHRFGDPCGDPPRSLSRRRRSARLTHVIRRGWGVAAGAPGILRAGSPTLRGHPTPDRRRRARRATDRPEPTEIGERS